MPRPVAWCTSRFQTPPTDRRGFRPWPKPRRCPKFARPASSSTPFRAHQRFKPATPLHQNPSRTPPPPKPLPKQEITLSSDTLFEFGKSTLRPEGEEAIANTARQVLDQYGRIDRIAVVGYTDAIGSKEVNRKLSTERANTVANLLNKNGLHPSRGYTTTGRGSSELAKLGCQNKPTPENKACHAPNRRVVIAIIGTTK